MNRKILFKKWTFLSISLLFILFGIYLTSKNTFLLVHGNQIAKDTDKHITFQDSVKVQKQEKSDSLYPKKPKMGENIGELIIPKLNATLPIFHGTNEDELEKGVGHFSGSVLPGEDDNSVLAGHRDTVFRKLGEVGVNDRLIVNTSAGIFTYKVRKIRIVDSKDRTVIVPKPRATLTVSTCYPFTFIGSAPQRYVLVAELISKKLV